LCPWFIYNMWRFTYGNAILSSQHCWLTGISIFRPVHVYSFCRSKQAYPGFWYGQKDSFDVGPHYPQAGGNTCIIQVFKIQLVLDKEDGEDNRDENYNREEEEGKQRGRKMTLHMKNNNSSEDETQWQWGQTQWQWGQT